MDRLHVIASESRRFADAIAGTDPQRRCPTCPDWTAADLLWHLTEVHFFWAGILAGGVLDESELEAVENGKPPRPEALPDLLALREQATAALVDQLARRADAEPCWSWWPPDQTVGFTRRMQTYEATMHRVDAELAAGLTPSPIATDVAAGALDHAADVMWGWTPADATIQAHATAEFVATDTDDRWLVEVGAWRKGEHSGSVAVRATSDTPAATVRAPVEDLALWAWTRGGRVEITGDAAAREALDALLTQGMT